MAGRSSGRPRLRLTVERRRPPVEHPFVRHRAEHHRAVQRRFEQLGRGPEPIVEVQDLRLTDRELEAFAVMQRTGVRGSQRLARRREVLGTRVLPESLELNPPEDDAGGVGWARGVIASRATAAARSYLPGVVEPAGLRQRRPPRGPATP